MKNYSGYIPFSLLLIAGLSVTSLLAIRSCHRQAGELQAAGNMLQHRADTLRRYTDAAGRQHAAKAIATGSEVAVAAAYRAELDSFSRAIGLRKAQLRSFALLGTRSAATVPLQVDTATAGAAAPQFSYHDGWLQLSGKLGASPQLSYSLHDSLALATYEKRHWLLGRKTTYIDAYSLNPAVQLSGLTAAQVAVRSPGRFGLGPYIGIGYSGGNGWKPTVGLSLQYALIRF